MNAQKKETERMPPRHVVVTGAGSGLGRALALGFAGPQTLLGLHYCTSEDGVRGTARVAEERGAQVYTIRADFATSDGWQAVAAAINARGVPLNVLVLNAGIARGKRIINMIEEDWDAVINVNYRSHAALLDACASGALQAGSHVVVVSSLVGLRGEIGLSAYAAAKGALIGLVQDVARRLGPRGICVNAILPGLLRTRMTATLSDEQFAAAVKENVLGHGTTCEEVAGVVVFLASLQNVSGQVFALDSRLRG